MRRVVLRLAALVPGLESRRNFHARARVEARTLRTPFAWELHTLVGVGHDARLMAASAARFLFPTPRRGGTP